MTCCKFVVIAIANEDAVVPTPQSKVEKNENSTFARHPLGSLHTTYEV
jgi:hypothetical protein